MSDHHPECPARDGNPLSFKCECGALYADRPIRGPTIAEIAEAAQPLAARFREPLNVAPKGAKAIEYDVRLTMGQREAVMRAIRRLQDPCAPMDVTDLANLLGVYARLTAAERTK